MSSQKIIGIEAKNGSMKNTMRNEMEKQGLRAPETPTEPDLTREPIIDVGCYLPDGLIHDELEGDDVKLDTSSPSKKRKNNQGDATKKKIYRPKVISQTTKRMYKSPSKSSNTPKPSTPKPKRSYVRKGPSCQRTLFAEEEVSLPFLKNFNALKVEQGGTESSIFKNESGIEYNSLQSYHGMTSLSCLCLVQSRLIGPNFSKMCKKKRIVRKKPRLEKFLIPFVKGQRSKGFIRKKRCWIAFNSDGNTIIKRKMRLIINKIRSMKKKRARKNTKKLVVYKESGELVVYKRPSMTIDVPLDEETLRVWDLLKNEKGHEENDEMKRRYWDEIRKRYRDTVESFISCMHLIQGDRRFLPWKGSVMDSVVGAFLTQNVSDHLSSSAFMSLAAKFPNKRTSSEEISEDPDTPDTEESITNNVAFSDPKFDKEKENSKVEEMEAQNANDQSSKVDDKGIENDSNKKKSTVAKKNKSQEEKEKLLEKQRHWDTLRKIHTRSTRHSDHVNSVDWEAVRCAPASKFAKAIASRGQHNIIAGRIQRLLNELKDSNGSEDLEWLRYAPPKEAKEYLLNIHGLGLKSVECIRLLTLQHIAFPVDVNVGRIVVRLGWVPLQPLPEPIQIHNLEEFPDSNKIQQYLWPRLCTLDQLTLYELHYQLITFGKVFCTKKNPNCNACPMRNECKHFASAFASTKLALPEPTPDQRPSDESIVVTPMHPDNSFKYSTLPSNSTLPTFNSEVNKSLITEEGKECEPIIEMPASPEPESMESVEFDVNNDQEFYKEVVCEDIEDIGDILTFKLNKLESLSKTYSEESENDMNTSTALVAFHADAANIPVPKMKNVSRLKTERLVYVLPDKHPLLAERTPREPDDPSPYLLLIWTAGELRSNESTNNNSQEEVNTQTGELGRSCESTNNSYQEQDNSQTVAGSLLIPCRTAMEGRFPLNGTYFQVNEVFADYDSMIQPINVPRKWLWNLEKRIVYFGAATSSIMKGLSLKQIHDCFWKGFVCVRAIDHTRTPRQLLDSVHRNTTAKYGKGKKDTLSWKRSRLTPWRSSAPSSSHATYAFTTLVEGDSNGTAFLADFTPEVLQHLQTLVDCSKPPPDKLSGKASTPISWLIDSDSSQDMTENLAFFTNVHDISPCIVGLPKVFALMLLRMEWFF
ncbi:transcriptional activator DEMETER-like [Gastrolobium bilobum]|uniref:transcriptional activator DEMETER-like n=1 Tax=Gastrolobium bilobum TaxID=150636 RepID=UPI002AB29A24|nr:transcriptional activator DEMETER-like [Gastrolobium bilobum]